MMAIYKGRPRAPASGGTNWMRKIVPFPTPSPPQGGEGRVRGVSIGRMKRIMPLAA
jgi:hypothetical protein